MAKPAKVVTGNVRKHVPCSPPPEKDRRTKRLRTRAAQKRRAIDEG